MSDAGLNFRGGPNIFSRNVGGKIIHEGQPQQIQRNRAPLGPFEPYIVTAEITGQTETIGSGTLGGTLRIAFGRVFTVALDGTEATITDRDTEITFTDSTKVWLKATFTAATGVITDCRIESGTEWPSSGAFSDGDYWHQRIAEIADPIVDESIPPPDTGDPAYLPSYGKELGDKHLFRYTYTHLRVESRCLDDETAWILTPA